MAVVTYNTIKQFIFDPARPSPAYINRAVNGREVIFMCFDNGDRKIHVRSPDKNAIFAFHRDSNSAEISIGEYATTCDKRELCSLVLAFIC